MSSSVGRESLLKLVFTYRFRWRLLILLSSFCAAVFGLAAPLFQKEFIDLLLGVKSPVHLPWFDSPGPWIVCAFFAMLIAQALSQLTNYLGIRESFYLQHLFAQKLYTHMINMRADVLGRRPLGEVVSLYATDVPGSTTFLDQTLPMGASTLFPLLLTPFAVSLFFETPIWGTVALMVFITLLNTSLAFRQSRFFYLFKKLAAERIGLVNEWVQNIRAIRVLGWTRAFENAIFSKRQTETINRVRMVTNGQLMNSISTSVTFFLNILTVAILSLWSEKELSPGELLALLWIMGVFLTRPFRQMPWFFTFMFDAWTSLQRLQKFMDLAPAKAIEPRKEDSSSLSEKEFLSAEEALSIKNLNLRVGAHHLLKNIDLHIKKHEFVAIVGEVGSGKSLLLLSLLKETGATAEVYRLHQQDALRLSAPAVKSHYTYVPQEGFIMSATLRENVAFEYDEPTLNDPLIKTSLVTADFNPETERVDQGLDAIIGERGVNLSGGQKQRVSLARAHYSDGDILLLDDCLSAVDVETEEKLLNKLIKGAWKNKTRLLVTHRLSILEYVDRILFMHDGQIKSQGTYLELLKNDPEFRQFTLSVQKRGTNV